MSIALLLVTLVMKYTFFTKMKETQMVVLPLTTYHLIAFTEARAALLHGIMKNEEREQ